MNNFECIREQLSRGWLSASASLLHAYVGQCYLLGRGTAVDARLAREHLTVAAEEGDKRSRLLLVQLAMQETPKASERHSKAATKSRSIPGNGQESTVEEQDRLMATVGETENAQCAKECEDEEFFSRGWTEKALSYLHELADKEGELSAIRLLAQVYRAGYEPWSLGAHLGRFVHYLRRAAEEFHDLDAIRMLAAFLLDSGTPAALQAHVQEDGSDAGEEEQEVDGVWQDLFGDSCQDTDDADMEPHFRLAFRYLRQAAHEYSDLPAIRMLAAYHIQQHQHHHQQSSSAFYFSRNNADEACEKDKEEETDLELALQYCRMGVELQDTQCIQFLVHHYHEVAQTTRNHDEQEEAQEQMMEYLRLGVSWEDPWCLQTLRVFSEQQDRKHSGSEEQ